MHQVKLTTSLCPPDSVPGLAFAESNQLCGINLASTGLKRASALLWVSEAVRLQWLTAGPARSLHRLQGLWISGRASFHTARRAHWGRSQAGKDGWKLAGAGPALAGTPRSAPLKGCSQYSPITSAPQCWNMHGVAVIFFIHKHI